MVSTFTLVKPAQSFFIEISGGLILDAAGLTGDEHLVDLSANVTLEIDTTRKVLTLTFYGQLKLYKLGTVGATSGRFVLDMGDGPTSTPGFWGVATLETNFSSLEPYGMYLFGKGTLQINTTGVTKTEVVTLKGIGAGGADVTRTFELGPRSFAIELVGQARIRPPGSTTDLVRMQGGFFLSIDVSSDPVFKLYATASRVLRGGRRAAHVRRGHRSARDHQGRRRGHHHGRRRRRDRAAEHRQPVQGLRHRHA